VDSLPKCLRNSKFLFNLSRVIFNVPESLFFFREEYFAGKIKDLSIYYKSNKSLSLKRISRDTDVNSIHLKILKKYFLLNSPSSLLDVGCGSGYLLNFLKRLRPKSRFVGIDYQSPPLINKEFQIIEGDILKNLIEFKDDAFEFVTCTHVIEHLDKPKEIIMELRRISSNYLIIILPMEKKFKWGLNYHINFYPNKNSFIDFIGDIYTNFDNKNYKYFTYSRLGDLMYVEHKIEKELDHQ